ncbi:hypothetical protein [Paenibacillus rigui]|uniref:Hydrolase n=1 Tax=Paenibacillus rigui TaxID=554312 RepID=A0A229URB2_9BACL|nr:hypothetical protein [Paenibacillus rigui]OXM85948.1 hypothetical protein CF651_12010 [Paenibacillus rigui]
MKNIYYVSVASATIEDNKTLADQANYAYEFVVEAREDEIAILRELLEAYTTDMEKTFARAPVPYKSSDHDAATEQHNERMVNLYSLLYKLGTPDTQKHIERMGIMEKLKHPDYQHEGYENEANY